MKYIYDKLACLLAYLVTPVYREKIISFSKKSLILICLNINKTQHMK